jgi:hypothetical protein
LSGFRNSIGNLPWILVAVLAVLVIIGLISMELFVDWVRNRRLEKVQKKFPANLYKTWQQTELKGWRIVLSKFLLLAAKIRKEFYPELTTNELEKNSLNIVDQHIPFKVRGR